MNKLFKGKNTYQNKTKAVGDFTITTSHKRDIILAVISVLIAITIWVIAVMTDGSIKTLELKYNIKDIQIRNSNNIECFVDDSDISEIFVTIKYRSTLFNKTINDDIIPYIDYNTINENSICELQFELPNGVALVSKNPTYLSIKIG